MVANGIDNLYSPHMVVQYDKNSNGTKSKRKNAMAMHCQYKRTYMYTAAWSREEVSATKFVHKFRAATFECNAGQFEIELFHKSYIRCVK